MAFRNRTHMSHLWVLATTPPMWAFPPFEPKCISSCSSCWHLQRKSQKQSCPCRIVITPVMGQWMRILLRIGFGILTGFTILIFWWFISGYCWALNAYSAKGTTAWATCHRKTHYVLLISIYSKITAILRVIWEPHVLWNLCFVETSCWLHFAVII